MQVAACSMRTTKGGLKEDGERIDFFLADRSWRGEHFGRENENARETWRSRESIHYGAEGRVIRFENTCPSRTMW
jgi:hypothetical protein